MAATDKCNLKRADPSSIQDKFLVGYQGWFTCSGDGNTVGINEWTHWLSPKHTGNYPTTDLWPDVESYLPSELFPVPGLKYETGPKAGEQAFLFSSRHPKTVQRHFNMMAEHGIDGAFLHRFVGQVDPDAENLDGLRLRDEIGQLVKTAAEMEGRGYAVMYDVCGVNPHRILSILKRDWIHLIRDENVLDSPNYLREKGKVVVGISGLGFVKRGHSPLLLKAISSFFRNITPGGVYIIAGVPTHWRTANCDADPDPGFLDVFLNDFDAISPWTIGRYRDMDEADHYSDTVMLGDIKLLADLNQTGKSRHVDYIPVVLPGASGSNMSDGRWKFNSIKRDGGNFLWRQIYNARSHGARTVYGATWDEYDEGTAMMPVVPERRSLPVCRTYNHVKFMALDEEGYELPSDWYMRICGLAADALHKDSTIRDPFPYEALRSYWSSHPKFESAFSLGNEPAISIAGSSSKNASSSTASPEYSPPPYSSCNPVNETTFSPVKLSTSCGAASEITPRPQSPLLSRSRPLPSIPTSVSPIGTTPTDGTSSFPQSSDASINVTPLMSSLQHAELQTLLPGALDSNDVIISEWSSRVSSDMRPAISTSPENASSTSISDGSGSSLHMVALGQCSTTVVSPPTTYSSLSSDSVSITSQSSQMKGHQRWNTLSRFLTVSRAKSEPGSASLDTVGNTVDPKVLKSLEKKRKKEETKARRERLAYELKMRSKADAQARAALQQSSTTAYRQRHQSSSPS